MRDLKGLLLGEMAVREKLLSEEQLDACVTQQIDERYARPLGAILLERGLVPQDRLDALLASQKAALIELEKSAQFGTLFGKIAVEKGFLSEDQLAAAVRVHARALARGARSRIGQVLIERNLLTIRQFWDVLHAQGDFACGTCGHRIEAPIFKGQAVVCEHCKAAAFEISAAAPGPRPKKRRKA